MFFNRKLGPFKVSLLVTSSAHFCSKITIDIYIYIIYIFFRNNLLIDHQFIKDNEIHVKIGGDHGGGSFKMSYQVANTLAVYNPNSKENTIIFSTFEAKDYRVNLKVGRKKEKHFFFLILISSPYFLALEKKKNIFFFQTSVSL